RGGRRSRARRRRNGSWGAALWACPGCLRRNATWPRGWRCGCSRGRARRCPCGGLPSIRLCASVATETSSARVARARRPAGAASCSAVLKRRPPATPALLARGLAYWESKRPGRRMPARRDIDPAEMLDLLPNVMLVDVVREPLDFRYRLIGTAIVAHMRHDYTGQRFSALPRQGRDSKLWAAAAR